MSLAIVYSRTNSGLVAPLVSVEVHLANGLPSFSLVGLPEAAVKESRDRVRAAVSTAGYQFPIKRITVNLAPADMPKDGGRFDLPIAIGILAASEQVALQQLAHYEFIGEVSLGGELRAVKGVLPTALATHEAGRALIVPYENAAEASLITGLTVYPAKHIQDVVAHLQGTSVLTAWEQSMQPDHAVYSVDMAEVKGQFMARRALEVAAAGGHNMLMVGPPGTGKTMLATRFTTILPPLTDKESLETAALASISQHGFDAKQWGKRPMRDPHHTASGVALVGGGAQVRPGEISLAHHGILFLDELTEFNRSVLDVLREPLETGQITLSRAARQATYPANFQLIAAMNPCPQGRACDFRQDCECSAEQQRRHRSKLSAPFLDRIDLHIEVPRLKHEDLTTSHPAEDSQTIRQRVTTARQRQIARQGKLNHAMNGADIDRHCVLSAADKTLLTHAMDRFKLSARAYHRILKVARSIADLANSEHIHTAHLSEALSYRALDRQA